MSEYPDASDQSSTDRHPSDPNPDDRHARDSASSSTDSPAAQPLRPGLISSGSAPVANRVSEVWADTAETQAAAAPASAREQPTVRLELTNVEARVLGALVEKSFLTPDVYPMTTNALATACNQKTNRHPVVDYAAVLIDSTLLELRQRNLVRRVHSQGSRSTKHRQTLDEMLALNERELALVSVLLLRGPQTMGELRVRTDRHDVGFDDLDAVEECLQALAGRALPLVEMLPRQPGHKENRWQHLLDDPRAVATASLPTAESGTEPTRTAQPSSSGPSPSAPSPSAPSPGLVPATTNVADAGLQERITKLEAQVATLGRQLAGLAAKLGEPLD